mgnify:CR=1 FL=1
MSTSRDRESRHQAVSRASSRVAGYRRCGPPNRSRRASLAAPQPSFPDTKFYVARGAALLSGTATPHSFGSIETDCADVDGIELELAGPARGTLHIQIYVRTFSGVEPEELRVPAKRRPGPCPAA